MSYHCCNHHHLDLWSCISLSALLDFLEYFFVEMFFYYYYTLCQRDLIQYFVQACEQKVKVRICFMAVEKDECKHKTIDENEKLSISLCTPSLTTPTSPLMMAFEVSL